MLIKIQNFHSRKCIWTYRLRNGGHFVQGWVNDLLDQESIMTKWGVGQSCGFIAAGQWADRFLFALWPTHPSLDYYSLPLRRCPSLIKSNTPRRYALNSVRLESVLWLLMSCCWWHRNFACSSWWSANIRELYDSCSIFVQMIFNDMSQLRCVFHDGFSDSPRHLHPWTWGPLCRPFGKLRSTDQIKQ